jgi:hypothetical protein
MRHKLEPFNQQRLKHLPELILIGRALGLPFEVEPIGVELVRSSGKADTGSDDIARPPAASVDMRLDVRRFEGMRLFHDLAVLLCRS